MTLSSTQYRISSFHPSVFLVEQEHENGYGQQEKPGFGKLLCFCPLQDGQKVAYDDVSERLACFQSFDKKL